MLKQRLLTILVLLPFVIYWVLYVGPLTFQLLLAALFAYSIWEYQHLIGLNKLSYRIVYLAILLILALFIVIFPSYWLLNIALFVWVLALIWIIRFPKETVTWANPPALIALGFLIFLPCWLALVKLRVSSPEGPALLMYLLLLVWATDIGAYCVGRLIGKHPLAPIVSPKKTIEGTIGGILLALLVALGGVMFFSVPSFFWWKWYLIALLTSGVSMVGDLFISMLKRQQGVKDTGQLLPGHGGILDRIDSILAAAPIFVWLMITMRPI